MKRAHNKVIEKDKFYNNRWINSRTRKINRNKRKLRRQKELIYRHMGDQT